MTYQLLAPAGNFRANMLLTIAELVGVKLELVHTEYAATKTPEFKQKNPLGKVPVLITPEGPVYESNAIARHLARTAGKLYGANQHEAALVDQYLDMAVTELLPSLTTTLYAIFGFKPADKEVLKAAKQETFSVLRILNERLTHHKYLAGENLTIADIQLATFLNLAFRVTISGEQKKPIAKVVEYFVRVAQLPEFTKYHGRPHFATSEFQTVAAPAAEAKDNKKKEAAKAKEAPKPKEAPKKKEEKVEEEEKEEQPASGWNLYDYKTLYVNAKNKEEAIQNLVENFDAKTMCIYHLHYQKYTGDGQVLYLFNNMKNNFLQRCDPARKVAFGTYSIYGEEPNLEISGVWLFMGATIPPQMNENPSFEYHDLKQLDITKAEDLQILRNYWTNTEEDTSVVDGLRLRSFGSFK
ncbi:glutathione S-transferase (macronuclear) [Tetrahymena thermophila SB210]|uniref:Glutathione S-transferase n=1 Tax=Tetrahymena thermophila (strain SB210) TaxID=312017 RepID=I7MIM2_TETTS|nr:glutathione S-transferase [Tetrahymena thermophila SB210]EAR93840.1 glutathione S-transferase [Tetrahymena thermophila SB210]|eukprot:XP_001014085.1 glutathione S-transferase [Tetrahymena thermophila SB210]